MSFGRSWAVGLAVALGIAIVTAIPAHAKSGGHGRLVNPFMGTEASAPDFGTGGGAGNTYPGASAPFGMLNWSPDTEPSTVNFPGGYTYSDTRIKGFSLTHVSGAGCSIYQDVPIIPTTEQPSGSPAKVGSSDLDPRYLAEFRHEAESARPGYYAVELDPDDPERSIGVELTADVRAGVARFDYPAGSPANLLINAGGSAMANRLAEIRIDPGAREVSGAIESGNFCYQRPWYRLHFVIRFGRRIHEFGTWRDQDYVAGSKAASDSAVDPFNYEPIPGGPPSLPGNPSETAQAGALLGFGRGGDLTARAGISFTSVADARRNLDAEIGAAGFRSERRQALRRWRRALGRVDVRGGSRSDRRTFYSSLYRALLTPRTLSDVDGSYPGFGGGTEESGRTRYGDFSGWDVYRTQVPLLAMLFRDRASDLASSLLAAADESGCLPKWALASGQTMVMVGDPAAQALASIAAFGVTGFDRARALEAMVRGGERDCRSDDPAYVERPGLDDYLRAGYIGFERNVDGGAGNSRFGTPDAVWGTAATTLEYALADFAVARMAAKTCTEPVYAKYATRSGNWREVLNPATGRAQPRLASGAFVPIPPESGAGFAEGSSAQYTFAVPHDPAGLGDALGGRAAAVERLDLLFEQLNAGAESSFAFLGNEPTLHAPWLYNWFGRPDRAQSVVRRAMLELYSPRPGGYPGNDDLGTLSAWWVLGALGLYPVTPGTDTLALSGPLFPRATLRLAGEDLVIRARGAGRNRPFVHGLRVGGHGHRAPWVRYAHLADGATLDFRLGRRPDGWGSRAGAAPPSYGPEAPFPRRCR